MSTAQQPEGKITGKIIDHIKSLPKAHARKVHQDRFSGGEPDVDAVIDGRAVKIEVKVPGKEPTPRQMAVMRRWVPTGALVGWVVSLDEAKALLEHLDDPDWVNPQLVRSAE